jgi:hypothetical protein
MQNFMKVRRVEAELFHAGGRANRDVVQLVVAFGNFANAPKRFARPAQHQYLSQLLSINLQDLLNISTSPSYCPSICKTCSTSVPLPATVHQFARPAQHQYFYQLLSINLQDLFNISTSPSYCPSICKTCSTSVPPQLLSINLQDLLNISTSTSYCPSICN